MQTYQDWLAHHGIPGMHWGERNGPPYPLRPMQYTKEELKEKKKAVAVYNKELRKAQNHRYRKADARVSNAQQRLQDSADKIKKQRDVGKISDEEAKAKAVKAGQKYADWAVRHANLLNIVSEGNDKVLDILDRAEQEGGLDLNLVTDYTYSMGKSFLASLARDTAYVGLNLITLPTTGIAVFPLTPILEKKAEKTDLYSVSVSKEYKNEVKRRERQGDSGKELATEVKKVLPQGYKPPQDTRLPDAVASEIWKGIAKKVEASGEKSLTISAAEKYANEIREDLLKDKNSEYYKYVHAGG